MALGGHGRGGKAQRKRSIMAAVATWQSHELGFKHHGSTKKALCKGSIIRNLRQAKKGIWWSEAGN